MGGTPSSARIIQDVDLALKALEIIFHANSTAVEGLAERNGHRRKKGHITKVRVASANSPTRFYSTVICCSFVRKKRKVNEFFPDTTVL